MFLLQGSCFFKNANCKVPPRTSATETGWGCFNIRDPNHFARVGYNCAAISLIVKCQLVVEWSLSVMIEPILGNVENNRMLLWGSFPWGGFSPAGGLTWAAGSPLDEWKDWKMGEKGPFSIVPSPLKQAMNEISRNSTHKPRLTLRLLPVASASGNSTGSSWTWRAVETGAVDRSSKPKVFWPEN